MKFRPLHDRVVIERIDANEDRWWHHHSRHRPGEAAAGQGHRRWTRRGKLIPIDIKVGDRILFGKWSGTGSNRTRGSGAICTPTRADGRFNL
jgi:chaperonin GroES